MHYRGVDSTADLFDAADIAGGYRRGRRAADIGSLALLQGVGKVGLAVTQRDHMTGTVPPRPDVSTTKTPDSEVTMDGNAVVVEEQMLRLNQIRTDFDTALSLYQKGLSLIRLAARSPN